MIVNVRRHLCPAAAHGLLLLEESEIPAATLVTICWSAVARAAQPYATVPTRSQLRTVAWRATRPEPRPDRKEAMLCDGIEPQQATTVTRARVVAAGPVHGRGEFELGCGGLISSQGDAEFSSESARIRVSVTVRAEAHGFFSHFLILSLPFFKLANHLES